MLKLLKYKNINIEFCSQITRPSGLRMFCYAYQILTSESVHVLVLTIEWSYYVHGTNAITIKFIMCV